MKHFYFWQNMVSMHQSSFLRALSLQAEVKVTLIVEEKLAADRVEMGWVIPDLGKVNLITFDDIANIPSFFTTAEAKAAVHIFSGIGATPKVYASFLQARKLRCKIGIMAEPLNDNGWKGKLRLLKYRFNKIRFGKAISFYLAIGDKAVHQYSQMGFATHHVYNWAYCVEPAHLPTEPYAKEHDAPFKLVFVGSMILRKGYDILIEALKELKAENFVAHFYCFANNQKAEAATIEMEAALGAKLRLLPFLNNNEVRQQICRYDVLVLPSRFDGWGAVVNEALSVGTRVIVSDNCGSSSLIKQNSQLGLLCHAGDVHSLTSAVEKLMKLGTIEESERKKIVSWSEAHISGEALVPYFMSIITAVNGANNIKPKAPWENNNSWPYHYK